MTKTFYESLKDSAQLLGLGWTKISRCMHASQSQTFFFKSFSEEMSGSGKMQITCWLKSLTAVLEVCFYHVLIVLVL